MALHSNGVRTIIERLDRLARDLMVHETIIADLQKNGFDLISVAEPDLMATDPTRILVRQIREVSNRAEVAPCTQSETGKGRRCEGRETHDF